MNETNKKIDQSEIDKKTIDLANEVIEYKPPELKKETIDSYEKFLKSDPPKMVFRDPDGNEIKSNPRRSYISIFIFCDESEDKAVVEDIKQGLVFAQQRFANFKFNIDVAREAGDDERKEGDE